MIAKKKSLLILSALVIAILAFSLIGVTYAWFLSRYSENYDFVLDSDSHVVLRYEASLNFASGAQSDAGNKILIAQANPAQPLNISQTALAPLDVFDSTKVATVANAVKFTATGAYWYGNETTKGALSFSLTATPGNDANYDLVHYGELGYVWIIEYLGVKVMLFDGKYYTNTATVQGSTGSPVDLPTTGTVTLPSNAFAAADAEVWYPIPANTAIAVEYNEEAEDVFLNGIKLLPNTRFEMTLYVFAAKADDFVDPLWNGQTVSLAATISVPARNNG